MSHLPKKITSMHLVMLLITVMLLVTVGFVDIVFMERFPWVDFLWLVPIAVAAVYLSPLETVAAGLAASIMSLTTSVGEGSHLNLWTSGLVGLSGIIAAVKAIIIRRHYHRVSMVRYALEKSPLAYGEFTFPGYKLLNINPAFRQMSDLAVGEGEKTSLHDSFPEDSAALMAMYMDEAVSTRSQTDCAEFHVPTADGKNTFWSVSYIPIIPASGRAPKTVALFAFEVTDAVARARTREAALRISAQAMSSLSFDETIRVVMDGLAYIAGTNAGSLFLLEEDQWVGKAGYGEHTDEMISKLRYPYDELVSAISAVEGKEVIAAANAAADARFSSERLGRFKVKSIIVVPLVTGNRVVGVVYLSHTDQLRQFTEEQIKFATIIGSHAALAIENALIYQNEHTMRKSLEAIEVVSEAGLVSLDLEEVLIELVTRTQDVMQMDAAMILLYDENEDCLIGRAATGGTATAPVSETRLEVGQGLAGRSFQEGVPMKIDNINGHLEEICPPEEMDSGTYPFSQQSEIVSVLAVPLRVAGKIIGILQIGSRREAAFSVREWGLIQVLADRASLAVQNSMLHERTKRELNRTALLKDVAAACASTHDIQKIAARSLDAIYNQLGCKIASIYFLDQEQEMLLNLAFVGHPDKVIREYRVSYLDRGSLLTRAVNERRIITHEHVNIDNATETEAHILRMLDIGYNRCARVPIIYQGEPVGAMALVFSDTRPFTDAGLETIESIANQLAVAFHNADPATVEAILEEASEQV